MKKHFIPPTGEYKRLLGGAGAFEREHRVVVGHAALGLDIAFAARFGTDAWPAPVPHDPAAIVERVIDADGLFVRMTDRARIGRRVKV